MEASRKRRGSGPRVAGAIAGAFAFGLGVTALVYFVELRGAGIVAELSSVRGPELLIYAGAVVLVALSAFFMVAAAARRSSGDAELQALLQRAREIDVTDPDALRVFDASPALRDVVAQLATEKAHVRELSDRLETLRGEFLGVTEGMRRSAQDLGHLREENLSGPAMQAVLLWNGLVDRLKQPELHAAPTVVGATVHADAGHSEVTALVTRLDELETELARLRDAMGSPAAPVAARRASGTWTADEPALEIETTATPWGASKVEAAPAAEDWSVPVIEAAPAAEDWGVPVIEAAPAEPGWGEPIVETAPAGPGWGGPVAEQPATLPTSWGTPEPHRVPEEPATLSARELFVDEGTFGPEEGFAQVAPEPQVNRPETRRVADPFAPRSLLPDEFGAEAVDPAPPRRAASRPPAPAAAAPPASDFEGMRFPEFVGGPRQRPADKVDLTYEGQAGDEVGELPASALLFGTEDENQAEGGVFDLRSFGATEFDK